MERYSHIKMAKALLSVAMERTDMAYLSTLPMIDVQPDFLHRLQCHPIVKVPLLVDCASKVFGYSTDSPPEIASDTYELIRIIESESRLRSLFSETLLNSGHETMIVDRGPGALLSVLSHVYFDTFNNPVQPFAPMSHYCAGQYDLWEKLDYFSFRTKWYLETAPRVCELVMAESIWNTTISAAALTKAMVNRLAVLTRPTVSAEAIETAERALGVWSHPSDLHATEFLVELERIISVHLEASVR